MQLNRNGFLYVLDRTNGKLIAANPYGRSTGRRDIDMKTGRPVETERRRKSCAPARRSSCGRGVRGGKNWPHTAFNPKTGLLYANTMHTASIYKLVPLEVQGRRALSRHREREPRRTSPDEPSGYIDAIDPLTGKAKWRVPLTDHPIWSAMLATAGGLLFTGKETGEFIALDAENGKQLWQFQTARASTRSRSPDAQRQAVRDGAVRHRRPRQRCPRATQERAAGRLGVDVRTAGLNSAKPGGGRGGALRAAVRQRP